MSNAISFETSHQQAELSKDDMISGVPVLLHKIAEHRPLTVCFVGKGIWEIFAKEAMKIFTAVVVTPSTPGPSSPSTQTPSTPVDEEVKEELPLADTPTPTGVTPKSGKKPKRAAKTKMSFNWGIQPIKVVHPDSEHGAYRLCISLIMINSYDLCRD